MPSIDAGHLLAELNERWRAMGNDSTGAVGKDSTGVLRACSMTLIAVATPDDDPIELSRVLATLTHDHPNRGIVLRLGLGDRMEASTAIQCWLPFGRRKQVCCEEIRISAPRGQVDQVPPILRGLCVPDLPVVVWCRDATLAASADLAPIRALAGKLIVEPSATPVAEALGALRQLRSATLRVADLAWTRITRWREFIAREASGLCATAPGEVTYSGLGEPMAALYLAAWLRNVMNVRISVRCEDPVPPQPGMGRIRAVRLAGLEMRRTAPSVVESRCGGGSGSSSVFPLLDAAGLLRDELAIYGADPHYEAALNSTLESA